MAELKRVQRRARVTWSRSRAHPGIFATAPVAGAVDLNFSAGHKLEAWELDFTSDAKEPKAVGALATSEPVHTLAWSETGGEYGIIAGGLDGGAVCLWDPSKFVDNDGSDDAVITQQSQHSGAVKGLDFNPHQPNLLASGARDSEIFIWDLTKPESPEAYMPGARVGGHSSDISAVAWNRIVPHILANTGADGTSQIWDLRQKRTLIQFVDPNQRRRCSSLAWHPEVATQLVTACEDDNAAVVQLWDLRNAHAPIRNFAAHSKGILSVAWCPFDPSLLLSGGKDNRTLCWNALSGELLYEFPPSTNWSFDVQWSPRLPAVMSVASFDGSVGVYSVQGFTAASAASAASDDPMSGVGFNAPTAAQTALVKHAPKWLQRPCGASFAFSGKLVTFFKQKPAENPDPSVPVPKATTRVNVCHVVTEPAVHSASTALDQAVRSQDLVAFCNAKAAAATSDEAKSEWTMLALVMGSDPRKAILEHLDFNVDKLKQELEEFQKAHPIEGGVSLTPVPAPVAPTVDITPPAATDAAAAAATASDVDAAVDGGDAAAVADGGDAAAAPAEGEGVTDALAPNARVGEMLTRVASRQKLFSILDESTLSQPADSTQLITKALLLGQFEAAVDFCLRQDRVAEALLLASYGGQELWQRTQQAYLSHHREPFLKILHAVVKDQLMQLCSDVDLSHWREILALVCTYARKDQFTQLCDLIGQRLLTENNNRHAAVLCFTCAGNLEAAAQVWISDAPSPSQLELQELVEKVTSLRVAFNKRIPKALNQQLMQYVSLLSGQGLLDQAIRLISDLDLSTDDVDDDTAATDAAAPSPAAVLHDRVFHASTAPAGTAPTFPFQRVSIKPKPVTPAPQAAAPAQHAYAQQPQGYPQGYPQQTHGYPQQQQQQQHGYPQQQHQQQQQGYPQQQPQPHAYPQQQQPGYPQQQQPGYPQQQQPGYQQQQPAVFTPASTTATAAPAAAATPAAEAAPSTTTGGNKVPSVSGEAGGVVDGLSGVMNQLADHATGAQRSKVEGARRKLAILYDELANSKVSEPVLAQLNAIVSSLQSADVAAALLTHRQMTQKHYAETTKWGSGVKDLLNLYKAQNK